jgi:hypothetical protein
MLCRDVECLLPAVLPAGMIDLEASDNGECT